MASAEILDHTQIGIENLALKLATNTDESRIRRAMRLIPVQKKTSHVMLRTVVGGAALLAGGFCLGWKAFPPRHK